MEVGDRVRILQAGIDDRGREYQQGTGMVIGKQGLDHAIVHIEGPEPRLRTIPMRYLTKLAGGGRGR